MRPCLRRCCSSSRSFMHRQTPAVHAGRLMTSPFLPARAGTAAPVLAHRAVCLGLGQCLPLRDGGWNLLDEAGISSFFGWFENRSQFHTTRMPRCTACGNPSHGRICSCGNPAWLSGVILRISPFLAEEKSRHWTLSEATLRFPFHHCNDVTVQRFNDLTRRQTWP